jgi:hypothetical protein
MFVHALALLAQLTAVFTESSKKWIPQLLSNIHETVR